MTDAAERIAEGDVLASGTAEPFATDVVVATDTHNELVNVVGRRIQYKYVVAIVYVTALFLDILDTTIVNVAIPALGEQFQSEHGRVGRARLHGQPRGVDPGVGLARRPVRHEADLPVRPRRVHRSARSCARCRPRWAS